MNIQGFLSGGMGHGEAPKSYPVPNKPPEPLSAEDETALREIRCYIEKSQRWIAAFDRLTQNRFK